MTINIGKTVFSDAGRICRIAAAMALLSAGMLAAGGCSTSNTSNTAPVAGVEGPKDTGSYPNLNIPPQVAAKQLTKEETDAKLAQLKGEQQAQLAKSGGGGQTASPAALNSLAKNHGDQALKQIETKCDPALDPSCN
ncbi:hypothetical protein [Mesorhizobium abyssinicae]|uniref:Uncharacterized protein n=1 Tax=Mesorhizobium abyssinicae TaxID=1209958 RepID=A0ABU5AIX7_9HYPH|nr:hypothetical protein [Mesorhizobium abyssinicae]MDX8537241.1 hypothetical protein [Mesorhizobium abyssinicae]